MKAFFVFRLLNEKQITKSQRTLRLCGETFKFLLAEVCGNMVFYTRKN